MFGLFLTSTAQSRVFRRRAARDLSGRPAARNSSMLASTDPCCRCPWRRRARLGTIARRSNSSSGATMSPATLGARYDVSLDGQRFLMIKGPGPDAPPTLILVQHWDAELKRLAPTK